MPGVLSHNKRADHTTGYSRFLVRHNGGGLCLEREQQQKGQLGIALVRSLTRVGSQRLGPRGDVYRLQLRGTFDPPDWPFSP